MNIGSHAPFRAAGLTSHKLDGLVPIRCSFSSLNLPGTLNSIGRRPSTVTYPRTYSETSLSHASKCTRVAAPTSPAFWRGYSTRSCIRLENCHRRLPCPIVLTPNTFTSRRLSPWRTNDVRLFSSSTPEIRETDSAMSFRRVVPRTDILPSIAAAREAGEPFAHIKRDPKGTLTLQIYLPNMSFARNVRVSLLNFFQGRPISLGNVLDGENVRRIKSKERNFGMKQRNNASKILRPSPSWHTLLRLVDRATPPMSGTQGVLKLHGSTETLDHLYEHVLNHSELNVIPEAPVIAWGEGVMRLAGHRPSLRMLQQVFDRFTGPPDDHQIGVDDSELALELHKLPFSTTLPAPDSAKRRAPVRHAKEIPEPAEWTRGTLIDFAKAIVRSRKPASITLAAENKDVAEEVLMDALFSERKGASVLSLSALHIALQFLVEHKQIAKARHFLYRMRRANFAPTIETYNIHLLGCASQQNLGAFLYWLRQMTTENIQPNDKTWLALLLCAPTVSAKQVTARVMHSKGLNAAAVLSRTDSPTLIPFSLGPFVDDGGSVQQYINIIDGILGQRWLSEQTSSLIANQLGQRGLIMEAVSVLDLVFARRGTISEKSALHGLLAHCSRYQWADLAIWLVIYAHREWRQTVLDHVVLEALFKVAIDSRMYNVARVTWKFAAALGEVKYSMRRVVLASLRQRLKRPVENVWGRWKSSMGVVVCGIDPLTDPLRTPEDILRYERSLHLRVTKPLPSFILMLAEALALDKTWTESGEKRSQGTEWKRVCAIQISFKEKEVVDQRLESEDIRAGDETEEGAVHDSSP